MDSSTPMIKTFACPQEKIKFNSSKGMYLLHTQNELRYLKPHMYKNINNMLIKCYTVCILYLKLFGGQTSKNVQDVWKLAFRRASVF